MPQDLSQKHIALMNAVKNSGAIDFKKLGDVVSTVTPQLFDPGVVADNYIASGYSDVVKVWKQRSMDNVLDDPAQLGQIAGKVGIAGKQVGG